MKTITITREDIESLQTKQPTYKKINHKGEECDRKYILTDNDEPLDFLCRTNDIWTYNEWKENNTDYIDGLRENIINYIPYKKAFLDGSTKEARIFMSENIDLFSKSLDSFIECEKKIYEETGSYNSEILENAFNVEEGKMYTELYNEYLNGDYQNKGALDKLKKLMEFKSFKYDQDTGSVTFSFYEDFVFYGLSKEELLDILAFNIRHIDVNKN